MYERSVGARWRSCQVESRRSGPVCPPPVGEGHDLLGQQHDVPAQAIEEATPDGPKPGYVRPGQHPRVKVVTMRTLPSTTFSRKRSQATMASGHHRIASGFAGMKTGETGGGER